MGIFSLLTLGLFGTATTTSYSNSLLEIQEVGIQSDYKINSQNHNPPENNPQDRVSHGNTTQGNGFQGGNIPNTTKFQFTFANNFAFNGSANQNISINATVDSEIENRFFGFHLDNQEFVNISLHARTTFAFTQQQKAQGPKSNILTNSIQQFLPNQITIFPALSTSDADLIKYEVDYSYNTFYQMDFNGAFESIDIYSSLSAELGVNPGENEQISWAIFDNSTNQWQLLTTTVVGDSISASIDGENIENSQLILTLVYISPVLIPENFWTSSFGLIIIGSAIVAIIFGSIMTNQQYRDYLLNRFLPINKGPHRLSMEDVLENENRSFIISTILDHPGIHFNELLRESAISAGTLAWHLDILETFKIIRKERVGQYLMYYSFLDTNPVSKLDPKLQKSRTTLEIMQLVKDNPGIYQNQIAKRMDLDHKTVKYHLDKLREADIVTSKKSGRRNLFYPLDFADI